MHCSKGGDDEGEQEVESEESSQRSVVYGEPSSYSIHDFMTYVWDSTKEVSDHGSPPESYLTSGEHIT